MPWKFEQEFRRDSPQTVGETDKHFDLDNYKDWLEEKLSQKAVPYQCCPKCNGQGTMSKPSHIPGDVQSWSNSSLTHVCDVCNGQKIILMFVSQP